MKILKSKTFLVSLFIYFSFNTLLAQTGDSWFIWPEGLGLSNQLEYSYNIDNKTEILENWLNLDYSKGIFSAGLRFEVFQPNDPDPSINRGKNNFAEIDYKYLRADIGDRTGGLDIVVGNYYSLFGRGMILKSYEDRAIRIDNNLLGLKVTGKYAGFNLTGLTGTAANSNNERKEILHAVDLEYKGWKPLKLGVTYASNLPDVDGAARTSMASLRASPSFWNIDIYAEYSILQNSDVNKNAFNDSESIVGQGFYGNLNFYSGSLSLSSEYKYYDNIAFTSHDGTIAYNTPPSVRLEYTYQLPNRHPSPLNPDNEQGFQVAAGYNLSDDTYFTGAYTQTETLPSSSYYQRSINGSLSIQTQLKELFFQGQHDWNNNLTTIAAFSYNEELATNTKNVTPILENKFYFDGVNTIKLIIEHQHTTNWSTSEQYFTDVVSIEYLRSPKFSVALVTEMQTKEPQEGETKRNFWGFIQLGYKVGQHSDVSILFGTRQAGNICIGGVCRFEPAFEGVELKLLTRL